MLGRDLSYGGLESLEPSFPDPEKSLPKRRVVQDLRSHIFILGVMMVVLGPALTTEAAQPPSSHNLLR